jgi:hypothetical protein
MAGIRKVNERCTKNPFFGLENELKSQAGKP